MCYRALLFGATEPRCVCYRALLFGATEPRCVCYRALLFGATEPRCVCYRALLFGGLRESRSDCCEVELKETNACAFKHILRYVYTAQMSLVDMQVGSVILTPLRTYRTNPNA